MNNTSRIHMGEIVEKQVRLSMVSITEVSKSLNVNRRTLYNWFSKPVIPAPVILNIGECIGYDFSTLIPQIAESKALFTPRPGIGYPREEESAYKMKYLHLLEKYNLALEELRVYRFST
ncbi:hypothetical protein BDE36_1173 [Arcticibacter tournemirensis]|uniref:Uncharacterized protein n=1 Tax=Arcticibacter tournemirensis TaxID=699437 RepID=A0A5M9H533_9SPHI|nr:hypothetical protein [Arcticibacter tournemirensis]KAA8482056.1 hypothetical protein F1649_13025 [Arcticibacter tournemirensis]TQM49468.1 hypothetical protein BDE36_1173 [Arcticibacter tournemirensis]